MTQEPAIVTDPNASAKPNDSAARSFLSESQQAGRAAGEIDLKNLDDAITAVTHILDENVAEMYKTEKEENWPTCKMALFCHDCRDIVPAGIGQTLRGNPRTVCGQCKSKKVSTGREDALVKFYHLEGKREKKEKTPARAPKS
ncbi:hypothetical protein HN954_04000 [bacterium]|jgi:hypothetical protein|nr:hypothetical protein [bacterium]MBT6831738.1 hypothetical protein [bacterium]MBT6996561.1 hypothetical protein [bacterium]MBT7772887.1 hypothetical protein [bacterium]